jgi:ubiquinone/menaquinone biosynthesis C-methylase UbiE
MIEALARSRPLAGKVLLDIGASPHGFALEWALKKGVSAYIGIGLGICETIEVRREGSVGRLISMDAEDLVFEPQTFDLIISLSTFEHFFDGAKVLKEMYRVLKVGGSVLIHFQPVWNASYGHHLHHIPSVAELIPHWAHLLWNEETMYQAYRGKWPVDMPMSLEETIEWIYRSNEINRIDVVRLRDMFYASDFEVEWMTPLVDDSSANKRIIAGYLSKILPYSADDLMTLGFSILMNKV